MPKEKLKSLRVTNKVRTALIKAIATIRFAKANDVLNEYLITFWWKACIKALETDGIDWHSMNFEYTIMSDKPSINNEKLKLVTITDEASISSLNNTIHISTLTLPMSLPVKSRQVLASNQGYLLEDKQLDQSIKELKAETEAVVTKQHSYMKVISNYISNHSTTNQLIEHCEDPELKALLQEAIKRILVNPDTYDGCIVSNQFKDYPELNSSHFTITVPPVTSTAVPPLDTVAVSTDIASSERAPPELSIGEERARLQVERMRAESLQIQRTQGQERMRYAAGIRPQLRALASHNGSDEIRITNDSIQPGGISTAQHYIRPTWITNNIPRESIRTEPTPHATRQNPIVNNDIRRQQSKEARENNVTTWLRRMGNRITGHD